MVSPSQESFHGEATHVIIQSTGCVDEGRFVVEDGSIVGVGTQSDLVFEDVVTGDPASVEGQSPASVVA